MDLLNLNACLSCVLRSQFAVLFLFRFPRLSFLLPFYLHLGVFFLPPLYNGSVLGNISFLFLYLGRYIRHLI